MRVKKFEAESVLEAISAIKKDLGPEAIILSNKEESRGLGQPSVHVVVAAVSDEQIKKKELTEKKLGERYLEQFTHKNASQQKTIINSVYKNLEDKFQLKNRKITSTPYIDIGEEVKKQVPVEPDNKELVKPVETGQSRVKLAAQAALNASLGSDFFGKALNPKKTKVLHSEVSPEKTNVWPKEAEGMMRKLVGVGVSQNIVEKLLLSAIKDLRKRGRLNKALIESWCAKWILNQARTTGCEIGEGIEVFVGPTGSGKTTALVKVAAEYVMNHRRKVAILTTDIKKVGGIEQHKVYSRILNIHFDLVENLSDLTEKIAELKDYDSILIDTPGTLMNREDEMHFLETLISTSYERELRTHLVLSATTKSEDITAQIIGFDPIHIKDVIFSNIDQTSRHGLLIDFQENFSIPIHSFGMSSDVIDGFEWATRERILDLIFKLTRINGDKTNGSIL